MESQYDKSTRQYEKALRTFLPEKTGYRFQRRRKYRAPMNHPWRQYRLTMKKAGPSGS